MNEDNTPDDIGLTFNQLREANLRRSTEFRNAKGQLAHPGGFKDGSWTISDWMTAITGELGEAANFIKKVRRGDMTLEEARASIAKEFADVVTYIDIAAFVCDIDLGEATRNKFNEISERVGAKTKI
jgi:NTP pyrophosphatase (non-canonical NTP hydrolase)